MPCVFRRFLILLLLLSLGQSGLAAADSAGAPGTKTGAQRLVIVFASANKGEPVFRMAENLLAELGRRMGAEIELISLPVN